MRKPLRGKLAVWQGFPPFLARKSVKVPLDNLTPSEILTRYKGQQSCETGFRFLKNPLFFADAVFLKTPSRIEAMAMLMGLSLLVYTRLSKTTWRKYRVRVTRRNPRLKPLCCLACSV